MYSFYYQFTNTSNCQTFHQNYFLQRLTSDMSFQSSHTELKNFLPLSKLGEGTFSTVYKVKRIQDGQIYALKKIKMQKLNQKEKQNALNEIRILASIKSDYIVSYKQAFYDQTLNLLCIVMEFAEGGDLQKSISDHLKEKTKFKEEQIWKAASQILIGLFILHQNDILHRDLKSANVFISNKNYKLGDLNVSKICNDQMAKTQTGTPYYASPEVWRDEPYNSKCDIWSFGCLLYEMCCLEPPFQGSDLDQLFKAVQKGQYRSIPSEYSVQLSSLIRLCLNVDPNKRYSARQLIKQFPSFNKKFSERKISFDSLLSTIRLPFDLKDLKNKLPLPDYENASKQCPKTAYHQNQNKETMLLRDKNIPAKQEIKPLPERIKSYFKQQKIELKKRPERPQTSSKRSDKNLIKNEIRPVSAVHCSSHKLNHPQILPRKLRIATQNQQLQIIKAKYNFKKQKGVTIETPKIMNRIKSCSPKNRPQKYDAINSRPISRNKEIHEQQQILCKDVYEQKINDINSSLKQIIPLNEKVYLQCKQNSIKRVSSLEKKVNYLREQRKQRKAGLDRNKQNNFSIRQDIIKNQNLDMKQRLKQKIKQNSQIFSLKRYQKVSQFQEDYQKRVQNSIDQGRGKYLNDIEKNLHNRKRNLYSSRNVFSAESKRMRSENSVISNKNQRSFQRNAGMIRKIPSNLLPSIGLQKKQLKRDFNSEINYRDINKRTKLKQPINNYSMIDNSDTIIRLKKRIKNRMIYQENQVKNIEIRQSLARNIPIHKFYY